MEDKMVQITKDKFEQYTKVQKSGKYNMIMDRDKARTKANLTSREYEIIQRDYLKLDEAWGDYNES